MNRLIMILALLVATQAAQADNYFTMGENDTLRIEAGSDTVIVPVHAHFDGLVDTWSLTLSWPEGLEGISVTEGPDMTVSYYGSQGETLTYDAVVTATADLTIISSKVTVTAYWPYGGSYVAYGHAMWASGDFDEMFYLTLKLSQGYSSGELAINGMVKGDNPFAGGVGYVMFYHPVTIIVTRVHGDVNGDGEVTISDVTALINLLLSGTATADCDLNGDGHVTISDVTVLINYLLSHQW